MEAAAIDLVCHDLPLHVVPSDVGIESLKPRSCAYSLRVILRDCSLTIVWFYSRTLKSHLMLGTRPFCSRFYYLPVLDTRGSRFCVPSSNHACDEYCPHDETLRISFLRCAQSIYFSCCYRAHYVSTYHRECFTFFDSGYKQTPSSVASDYSTYHAMLTFFSLTV